MATLPTELYLLGFLFASLNIGLAIWTGGFLGVVNLLSGGLVIAVLIWSFLGAPGTDRLASRLYQ